MAFGYGLGFYNTDILTYAAVFLIFFSLVFFSLSKFFGKKQKGISAIISLAISFLAVQGLSRANISFANLFYRIGLTDAILPIALGIIFLILIIVITKKIKAGPLFAILGVGLIAISFTNLIYEKFLPVLIGIILIVISFFMMKKPRTRP